MRIVFKIGTSLLTKATHELDRDFLREFTKQIAAIQNAGHQIIIVSSGAVAAGRGVVTFDREKKNIPFRQALAAIGQGILMHTYHEFFCKYGIAVSQALLTNFDFVNRENFLNAKNVFELLIGHRVIPIVNENDVTTVAELKFGDNDMLSAKTASLVSADLLVIFTDVDGLFTGDPKKNPDAKIISAVTKINSRIKAFAKGPASSVSLGGMKTKLEAAEYVTSAGIPMVIANGRNIALVRKITDFFLQKTSPAKFSFGTYFSTSVNRLENQKKWLRPKIQAGAWVLVDSGAAKALRLQGKSLLSSGISEIHGKFSRGDVLKIKDPKGEIGYGQVNYGALDLDKIKKHHSSEIEQILGYSFEEEVMHRDRMVILP